MEPNTFYLKLDDNGYPFISADKILSVPLNSTVHISLPNGTPISKYINLISNAESPFPFHFIDSLLSTSSADRMKLTPYSSHPSITSTSISFELHLTKPGPTEILFIYYNEQEQRDRLTTPFFILVQPQLNLNNKQLAIEDISLQTVLSKSLGNVSQFEQYLKETSSLKFNFIHLTPIQKLGDSDSLYCLSDNTEINDFFYKDVEKLLSNEEKMKRMKEVLDMAREKYGIGSIVDIVLNHASQNSKWLVEHPECGYNLVNSPWLRCAYEFDKVLVAFGNDFENCKTEFEFQPYVKDDNELNKVMDKLRKLVNECKLEEFFYCDVTHITALLNNEMEAMLKKYESKKDAIENEIKKILNNVSFSNEDECIKYIMNSHNKCLDHLGENRNGVTINSNKVSCIIMSLSLNTNNEQSSRNPLSLENLLSLTSSLLCKLNNELRSFCESMISNGLSNIRAGIHYEFVHMKNKADPIKKPLINRYFSVIDPSQPSLIFACNGWIMESEDPNDPTPNFTQKGSYYYFKRKVMIWSDCLKLNYGTSIEDCPFLISHMTKYVKDMAKLFDGFRLDNAHSTPIYVAEYLIQQARTVNPNLIVMAELFTSKENEVNFVNKIGINLMIRELIWCNSPNSLAGQIHRYGGGIEAMLGRLDTDYSIYSKTKDNEVNIQKINYLIPRLPMSILYDQTHDNETLLQKYNNLALNLTNLACNSFSSGAIGSTRGYDQLFPIQPLVVRENRKYEIDMEWVEKISKEKIEEKVQKINFEYKTTDSNVKDVKMAFDSHGWVPNIIMQEHENQKGYFTATVELTNHSRHYFKYVINDTKWECADHMPIQTDHKGNMNNFIDVGFIYDDAYLTMEQPAQTEFNFTTCPDLKQLRRKLNIIREDLATFPNDIYIKTDNNYLSIFRVACLTRSYLLQKRHYDGYALICCTGHDLSPHSTEMNVELPGIFCEFVCGCILPKCEGNIEEFRKNLLLKGNDYNCLYTTDINYFKSISSSTIKNGRTIFSFNNNVKANSVFVVRFKAPDNIRNALMIIEDEINGVRKYKDVFTKELDMCDINLLLYKCEREELDNSLGKRGNYYINKWKTFVYAGISHLHKMLQSLKVSQENHPILDNVREGDWLLHYELDRLKEHSHFKELHERLKEIAIYYKELYVHLKPIYLTKIMDLLFDLAMTAIMRRTNNCELINYSEFSQQLITAIYQFTGYVESSRFKYNTSAPFNKLSMSAGLPHFSNEYMRCWGRDTFIALRGLLLIPGYFNEAKEIIINYASTMRHGLIPNLLDSGVNPRYNARDATWFFMNSIKDYTTMSKDNNFFNTKVNMLFLDDDYYEHFKLIHEGKTKIQTIAEIMHCILSKHANGITFREWRAGKQIDEQMKDEGFNINIYTDLKNGFVYGGNKFNCGTWMDKMGSSDYAQNKGIPATPRNGANIEIIALLYSTLKFLIEQNKKGFYNFNVITLQNGNELKYEDWAKLIENNFDKEFYLAESNIYKDYISIDNDIKHESQLRPNVFIAMSVAPELFSKEKALKCIESAEQKLVANGSVGIRTLDNTDSEYNGYYNVDDHGNNYNTAHGFNYHNGPEWVFPFGYYLNAKIMFNEYQTLDDCVQGICKKMLPCIRYIERDEWSGLPELVNKDGQFCFGSCSTQAWSIGTVLEAVERIIKKYNGVI